jgi:hypothetical protein
MMDLELIRSVLIDGLSAHLEMPVLEIDAEASAAYPFITYSYSGPVVFPGGIPAVTLIPAENGEITERYMEQPTFRMSFNSCSDRQLESLTNAVRMHDWFRIIGCDELKRDANVAVVKTGKIKNRDALIDGVWVRKSRFYVTLRIVSVVDSTQTTIQTVNWN